MSEAVAEYPTTQPPFPVEEQIITERAVDNSVICVIYTGDVLSNQEKQSPNYRLGGKAFPWPEFVTVPNHVISRCQIVRLRKHMIAIPKWQIEKDKWPLYIEKYTLTNQWDPAARKLVDITYGVNGGEKDFVYKAMHPATEVGMLLRHNEGIVQLTGDAQLNTAEEIRGAQLHYFPNWLEILTGRAQVPFRMADLEAHIEERRAAAPTTQFRAVGDAYLYSCSQFREFAARYIAKQTDVIEETKGKGVSVRYDEIAERFFRMCDITREDKMIQNYADSQQDTKAIMAQMAETNRMMANLLTQTIGTKPAEEQQPAPETLEQAEAVMHMASEENFMDMTAAVVETEELDEAIDVLTDNEPNTAQIAAGNHKDE